MYTFKHFKIYFVPYKSRLLNVFTINNLKGQFIPKIKILSQFTLPLVVSKLYDCLL